MLTMNSVSLSTALTPPVATEATAIEIKTEYQNNTTHDTQGSLGLSQPILLNDRDSRGGSASSSQRSLSTVSLSNWSDLNGTNVEPSGETSQEYIDGLIKQVNEVITDELDNEYVVLLKKLSHTLAKTKHKANSYKIKSELLSISSKDADMRYEVENDLIKREVESLKTQGENLTYLMNKINKQKLVLKKYKNEIQNKNREIIELREQLSTLSGTKKRKLFRSNTSVEGGNKGNMLDTLGLLASQVLTEEEQSFRKK